MARSAGLDVRGVDPEAADTSAVVRVLLERSADLLGAPQPSADGASEDRIPGDGSRGGESCGEGGGSGGMLPAALAAVTDAADAQELKAAVYTRSLLSST